jgi:hypothetical protein
LVANPEEMEPELEHQEVLRKRPWWRWSRHLRTDTGTAILP